MYIAHNMASMNANRQYGITNKKRAVSTEKLSSGYRINRAADDAAGLTISEKMRGQIRGLDRGSNNVQDGISLLQVADGALNEVQNMLHRITELSIQAANDTNTFEDREAIQAEIAQLTQEIDKIGKTTEFNTMPIFDDMFGNNPTGSVTELVSSPSAESGFLSEAIQVGSVWCSAGSVDFTNINSNNINKLNNQGFSFNCSENCDEVFEFKFKTDGDGTLSSASNLVGKTCHKYVVDISDCNDGKDIVNKIYDYVSANPPTGNFPSSSNLLPGCLSVSHSNAMIKSADGNKLIIYANSSSSATENAAKHKYPNGNPKSGAIDCSELTSLYDEILNEINIQAGANSEESILIHTTRMNSQLLGLSKLKVDSYQNAQKTLVAAQKANERVSKQRAELGADQNRLEHAFAVNGNTGENLTASESKIRDTDMAKEIVELSKESILSNVGEAMLAQANKSTEFILNLLQ